MHWGKEKTRAGWGLWEKTFREKGVNILLLTFKWESMMRLKPEHCKHCTARSLPGTILSAHTQGRKQVARHSYRHSVDYTLNLYYIKLKGFWKWDIKYENSIIKLQASALKSRKWLKANTHVSCQLRANYFSFQLVIRLEVVYSIVNTQFSNTNTKINT